jgi:multiple sugar transport system permease protein
VTTWRVARKVLLYAVLTLVGVSIVYPLLWMVVNSFRDNGSVLARPFGFGGTWGWANYHELLNSGELLSWLRNSVVVNVFSVLLIAILAALAAYGFSTFRFRGRNVLFGIVIIGLTIPPQALAVAGFRWVSFLNLQDSYVGLICTYGGWTSFGILMLRNFFDSLPTELREAALMDGASHLRIFWQVALPLDLGLERLRISTGLHPVAESLHHPGRHL